MDQPSLPGRDTSLGWPLLLAKGRLCEILSAPLQEGAAAGFCVAIAQIGARGGGPPRILWLRHTASISEAGNVHAAGLVELGMFPARTIFVTLPKPIDILRAAVDAARCAALDSVIMEVRGDAACVDLTATRRLVLAVEASGVSVFLLRHGGREMPSAAWVRWRVRAAPSRSRSPYVLGPPRYEVSLLRHRGGQKPGIWIMEWNRDRAMLDLVSDKPALSYPVVSVPDGGSLAA